MTTPPFARLGAACGIIFAVGMFLTAGSFGLRGLGLAAIVVFIPFLAYLCSVLRQAEGSGGWLAQVAFAGGLSGITLKLASIAPEIATHRFHIAGGTQLHDGLQGVADAATDISLYPLAVMLAATAVVALRTQALPPWLGVGAAVS